MRLSAVFLCFMLLSAATSARADQDCNALLRSGIYDYVKSKSSSDSNSIINNQICQSYSKLQQDIKSGSVQASYELASGSASFSAQQLEAVAQQMCKSDYSDTTAANLAQSASAVIDPTAVQAWHACIELNTAGIHVKTTYPSDNG